MDERNNLAVGGFLIVVSQIVFMITGYIVSIVLANVLGTTEYGIYSVVISLFANIDLIFSSGIPQSISKFTAERPNQKDEIFFAGIKVQLILGVIFSAFIVIFSKSLAQMFNDISLSSYFRLGAILFPLYSLFFSFYGTLNGRKLFKKQAIIHLIYSVSKVVFIFAFVFFVSKTAFVAILGFVISPSVGIIISLLYVKIHIPNRKFPIKKILYFMIPVTIVNLISNFLLSMDLFFLKALLPSEYANAYSGIYSAMQIIARIPIFLIYAIGNIIFPIYSHMTHEGDYKKSNDIASNYVVLILVFILPFIFVIWKYGYYILKLFYTSEYLKLINVFWLLALSMGIMGFFFFYAYLMNARGATIIPLIASIVTIGLQFVIFPFLIRRYSVTGAALGSIISSITSLIIVLLIMAYKRYALHLPLKKILYVFGINLIYDLIFAFIDSTKFLTNLSLIISYALGYAITLLLIGKFLFSIKAKEVLHALGL